jgi:pyridoxine 5-phosphate synthase
MIGRLGVNIDHIATLRQLRGTPYPDLVEAARLCAQGGAEQITVHLREDRRHIQDDDVYTLRKRSKLELNLEMAVTDEMVRIARKVKPDWTCLVPEKRTEVTTEGGLDVLKHRARIARATEVLAKSKILVSWFIEPDVRAVKLAAESGAHAVELHTGRYCLAAQGALGKKSGVARKKELTRIRESAELARKLGMRAHAGHGFDFENVRPVAALGLVEEFNIGHAIVCRASMVGMLRAVREMVSAIQAP